MCYICRSPPSHQGDTCNGGHFMASLSKVCLSANGKQEQHGGLSENEDRHGRGRAWRGPSGRERWKSLTLRTVVKTWSHISLWRSQSTTYPRSTGRPSPRPCMGRHALHTHEPQAPSSSPSAVALHRRLPAGALASRLRVQHGRHGQPRCALLGSCSFPSSVPVCFPFPPLHSSHASA